MVANARGVADHWHECKGRDTAAAANVEHSALRPERFARPGVGGTLSNCARRDKVGWGRIHGLCGAWAMISGGIAHAAKASLHCVAALTALASLRGGLLAVATVLFGHTREGLLDVLTAT
jgi:hypothetical protein